VRQPSSLILSPQFKNSVRGFPHHEKLQPTATTPRKRRESWETNHPWFGIRRTAGRVRRSNTAMSKKTCVQPSNPAPLV